MQRSAIPDDKITVIEKPLGQLGRSKSPDFIDQDLCKHGMIINAVGVNADSTVRGTTLSSSHVTAGVTRVVSTYGAVRAGL